MCHSCWKEWVYRFVDSFYLFKNYFFPCDLYCKFFFFQIHQAQVSEPSLFGNENFHPRVGVYQASPLKSPNFIPKLTPLPCVPKSSRFEHTFCSFNLYYWSYIFFYWKIGCILRTNSCVNALNLPSQKIKALLQKIQN